jgi:hypothetical protein
MAASEKWLVSDDHRLPVGQVAAQTLRTRFDAVWMKLRASCAMPDTVEHVHQLRVATRRTLAAFEAFHAVIPAKRRDWFEKRLRRLRRAAGEARDLDVLTERLTHDSAARDVRRADDVLSINPGVAGPQAAGPRGRREVAGIAAERLGEAGGGARMAAAIMEVLEAQPAARSR